VPKNPVDHDQLVVAELIYGPMEWREPHTGMFAIGVEYETRMSDTLRALGFLNGVQPQVATKVIVTKTGDRIHTFVNRSAGGYCRPSRP